MANLSEWQLIASLNAGARSYSADIALQAGDDCALWRSDAQTHNAISTDTLVSGVHFPENLAPQAAAYRALMVNLSDLAAMGATPLAYLNSLTLSTADSSAIASWSQGLRRAERQYQLSLLGGNICRASITSITISIIGQVPRGAALRRAGAQAGDDLYVSGSVGAAALGLAITQQHGLLSPRSDNAAEQELYAYQQRYLQPLPRLQLGLHLRSLASACIDISDGLYADLVNILQASKLSACIDPAAIPLALPQHNKQLTLERDRACSHGDDYELLFSAPVKHRQQIDLVAQRLQLALTRIGVLESGQVGSIRLTSGAELPPDLGYKHF